MACQNNYIPEYIPKDLPWYERDGLMTYIDQEKCGYFLFTGQQARGDKVLEDLLKIYQTIEENKAKYDFLASVFKRDRSNIYFEENVVINHFKGK